MIHGEIKEIKRNIRIMLWNIEGLENIISTIATDFLDKKCINKEERVRHLPVEATADVGRSAG